MTSQVIFRELNEIFGWFLASVRKDLLKNMGAQLLDADVVVS